jgi:hypothetical protein
MSIPKKMCDAPVSPVIAMDVGTPEIADDVQYELAVETRPATLAA